MMKIKVFISAPASGITVTIPDEELEGLSEREKGAVFEDYAQDLIRDRVSVGWDIIEE